MGRNQHVVPTGDKWGIKGEGNSKYTQFFDRQRDAIDAARNICKPPIQRPHYLSAG